MSFENPVQEQYEKFPYPPVGALALPRRDQGEKLRYELGCQLAFPSQKKSHRGIRILVAGAGTLEALVTAQAHPLASEVVAVDLSQASLATLQRRIYFARVARFPLKLPPIRLVCAELSSWVRTAGEFDYIIASNVLHHFPQPARLLQALSAQIRPDGLLRMVTYPKASRIWMRRTSEWLRSKGIAPGDSDLVHRCRNLIRSLPGEHPIRSCFESQPETSTATGIVDAFLNACENPLSPLEWKAAAEASNLKWVGETQTESSRSTFLDELVPRLAGLDSWIKLQILDDFLELCANPILWLKRGGGGSAKVESAQPSQEIKYSPSPLVPLQNSDFSKQVYWELKQNLTRSEILLQGSGVSTKDIFELLKKEVGPRVESKNPNRTLPGLSITDYDFEEIQRARDSF